MASTSQDETDDLARRPPTLTTGQHQQPPAAGLAQWLITVSVVNLKRVRHHARSKSPNLPKEH